MTRSSRARTWRRDQTRLRLVTLLLMLLISRMPSASAASRVEPFDPLARLEQQIGAWRWDTSLEYLPDVRSGTGVDTEATSDVLPVYAYEHLSHRLRACLSATYRATGRLFLSPTLCHETQVDRESRTYYLVDTRQPIRSTREETLASAQGSLEFVRRLSPAHHLDPRVSVVISYPWRLSAGVSASFLRDPVVVSAELGYSGPAKGDDQLLWLQWGAGFVANERFSFTLVTSFTFPVGSGGGTPTTRIGLRVLYAPQPGTLNQLSVESLLSVGEGVALPGFSVGWQGQLRGGLPRPQGLPSQDE